MQDRLESIIGAHDAAALTGGDMQRQLDNLAAIEPTLGRLILERGFRELVAGAIIGFREWNLTTPVRFAARNRLSGDG